MERLKMRIWPDLGLQMELLISPAGVPTIRWSDPETDRGFGLVQYSTLEMAEARFAAEVAKAEKNLQPQPTTKGEGGRMIKTGFSPERIDAEAKYAIALEASRRAENVSEEAYKAAEITLADARLRLVIAEVRWPTPIERARPGYSAEAEAWWNT